MSLGWDVTCRGLRCRQRIRMRAGHPYCKRCEARRRLAYRKARKLCRYTGTCREGCVEPCKLQRIQAESEEL